MRMMTLPGSSMLDEYFAAGQSYNQRVANLDLSLNQSNVSGASTIGYIVTLSVSRSPIREPSTIAVLGGALAGC